MFNFNVGVIIPAAGNSVRFHQNCPKQYFKTLGKPLFLYCLEAFIKLPYITKICLVSDRVEYAEELLSIHSIKQDKLIITKGGPSRHASIKNGLNELRNRSDLNLHVIVVHDGARPIVPVPLVEQLICEASKCGAAGSTRPLTSTVVRPLSTGELDVSLDRSTHVSSKTPQAFLSDLLSYAYQKCSQEELDVGTECLQLVLKYCGVRAKLIEGPDTLWKVTDKKDLFLAEGCLRELSTKVCVLSKSDCDLVRSLQRSLEEKVCCVTCHITGRDEKPSMTYNTIVCLHDREIDQDSQILLLADILDISNTGIIIHIVLDGNVDDIVSGSVQEFLRCGRSMMNQYKKLKKGVAIIHFNSPGEETQLVDLVSALILSDPHVFSGQTFFI